jgi:hypothetical protein
MKKFILLSMIALIAFGCIGNKRHNLNTSQSTSDTVIYNSAKSPLRGMLQQAFSETTHYLNELHLFSRKEPLIQIEFYT